MLNLTPDQFSADDITTTSATATIPFEVDHRQTSNFETNYQTISSALIITLQTPRAREERV